MNERYIQIQWYSMLKLAKTRPTTTIRERAANLMQLPRFSIVASGRRASDVNWPPLRPYMFRRMYNTATLWPCARLCSEFRTELFSWSDWSDCARTASNTLILLTGCDFMCNCPYQPPFVPTVAASVVPIALNGRFADKLAVSQVADWSSRGLVNS